MPALGSSSWASFGMTCPLPRCAMHLDTSSPSGAATSHAELVARVLLERRVHVDLRARDRESFSEGGERTQLLGIRVV